MGLSPRPGFQGFRIAEVGKFCTWCDFIPEGLINTNITDEECGKATNLYYYTLVDIVEVGTGGRL